MHYLGREYMYYGKYQECIDTLIHHLSMKKATWKDERCASMRFIGRSYKFLKRYDEAKMWYEKAFKEAPYLRDAYVELALLYYELHDYGNMIKYCHQALRIKEKKDTYINEVFSWNYTIYDLLSIGFFESPSTAVTDFVGVSKKLSFVQSPIFFGASSICKIIFCNSIG